MRRGPLKPSRFNTRTTLADGTLLLFNFVSLAIVALEPRRAARAGEILDGALDRGAAPGYRRLAALLARNGFLVGADEDELAPLRAAFLGHRRDSTLLSLTVVPTLSCNFACTYCSQGPTHRGEMTREVEDALCRLVDRWLAREGRLEITWYGGEPLLARRVIDRLSLSFLALCRERRARYQAAIVTNGYLLDEPAARWLKERGVRRAQVTLDGPPAIHDGRRPLASGAGTFARIVDNLRAAADVLTITVRTNVDAGNRSSVGPLLDALVAAGIAHEVAHYTAPVTPSVGQCADAVGPCLGPQAFSIASLEASIEMTRRGVQGGWRPRVVDGPCGATRQNGFVVAPDGGLVSCWEELGRPDRYLGHLLAPETSSMAANRRWWAEYDPFALECRDCQVLPICMSSCPLRVREGGRLRCCGWKHHPREYLLNEYRLRMLDRERQVAAGLLELQQALRAAVTARH